MESFVYLVEAIVQTYQCVQYVSMKLVVRRGFTNNHLDILLYSILLDSPLLSYIILYYTILYYTIFEYIIFLSILLLDQPLFYSVLF